MPNIFANFQFNLSFTDHAFLWGYSSYGFYVTNLHFFGNTLLFLLYERVVTFYAPIVVIEER